MNPNSVMFTKVVNLDTAYITFYVPGDTKTIDSSHPNFEAANAYAEGVLNGTEPHPTADQIEQWLDIPKAIQRKFERLSERVAVRDGAVCIDGDPVDNVLTEQILDFMNEGVDFAPLVNFYEKLLTNPLGDVRDSLFTWIKKQIAGDNARLTITRDGDLIGYKAFASGELGLYPSRQGPGIVNGVEGVFGVDLFQQVGDVVEMPRSTVLHDFSQACGDGLHVGTSTYAFGFMGYGSVKTAVRFNPRDVVSVPVSEGKIRVCRYRIEAIVPQGEAFSSAVYESDADELPTPPEPVEDPRDLDVTVPGDGPLVEGDRVTDDEGDEGTVVKDEDGKLEVEYDSILFNNVPVSDFNTGDGSTLTRSHGKGGATSQAAKGNGRNPAQDQFGRFSAGRPNSSRDSATGRFA